MQVAVCKLTVMVVGGQGDDAMTMTKGRLKGCGPQSKEHRQEN
jgi:hypothetical protein